MFDTESFLNQQVEGEMSTEFTPVPEGEYTGIVKDVKARQAKDSHLMDVVWEIDDEEARRVTGMEHPTVRQTIFLDLTDNGGLDLGKGKNIALGRLRDALNQNGPGAWSPAMLLGQAAKVRVEHRLYEGRTFADVKGVAKLG